MYNVDARVYIMPYNAHPTDDPVGMWQDLAVMVTSSTAAKEGHAKEGHIYEVCW